MSDEYFERRQQLRRLGWGGDGSHWEDCHKRHWDCRIMRLEDDLKQVREQHARDHAELQAYREQAVEAAADRRLHAVLEENRRLRDENERLQENATYVGRLAVRFARNYEELRRNVEIAREVGLLDEAISLGVQFRELAGEEREDAHEHLDARIAELAASQQFGNGEQDDEVIEVCLTFDAGQIYIYEPTGGPTEVVRAVPKALLDRYEAAAERAEDALQDVLEGAGFGDRFDVLDAESRLRNQQIVVDYHQLDADNRIAVPADQLLEEQRQEGRLVSVTDLDAEPAVARVVEVGEGRVILEVIPEDE